MGISVGLNDFLRLVDSSSDDEGGFGSSGIHMR